MKTKSTRYSRTLVRENYTGHLFALLIFIFSSSLLFSQSYTRPGTYTWIAPCGVTSITVEAWGGGGAGGGIDFVTGVNRGGGGGGGAYARSTVSVTSGASYTISVGRGGAPNFAEYGNGRPGQNSTFGGNIVVATGGAGGIEGTGSASTGGAGATAASCTGTNSFGGGNSLKSTGQSGSGGGGAGNTGNGLPSTAGGPGAGGTGSVQGGAGASGVQGNTNGNNGFSPGGGGSGANAKNGFGSFGTGGSGGDGQVLITYTSSLPTSYCVTQVNNVRPITNVTFAGINNTTSNSTNSPSNEYFCTPEASVITGNSVPISVKGNTNGNWKYNITVFIDWDKNGVYGNNSNEKYDVGSITNSTGVDVKVMNALIAVPSNAPVGSTRMRVVMNYDTTNNACTTLGYGQTEDYTVVVATPLPCTGTPAAGTMSLSPTTGAPNSTFTGTVTGDTSASGLTYQWQIGDSATGPWVDIPGATNATQTLTAVSAPNTTKYYRRKIICAGSGTEAISNVVSFKTTTVTYCAAQTTSRENLLFINSVSFLGTLADYTKTSTFVTNGYNDFTSEGPTVQADGAVVNVNATVGGTRFGRGTWKAWVDWNGNGTFDSSELVYSNYGYLTGNVVFGFVVPSGQASGNYRLRIRVNNYLSNNVEYLGSDFSPCDNFNSSDNFNGNFGETEDYTIKVIYNCPAQITGVNISSGDGQRCGTGKVILSASGTGVSYKWYTVATGGTAIGGATGSTYETPSISTSRYYYVTAVSAGGCETVYRTPVYALINPAPVVNFTTTATSICGDEVTKIDLTSTGDKREATVCEENFSTTTPNPLGKFDAIIDGAFIDENANWKNNPSPYTPANPPYASYKPALSSGYTGGNFASIITAISRTQSVLNRLVLRDNYDTTDYLNLKMDFNLYYYSTSSDATDAYLKIDYSTNGGSNWINFSTITNNIGTPGIFELQTISLPNAALNSTQFKVRFTVFSISPLSGGWIKSATAIDNIRIYGEKPVTTAFSWTGDTSVLYEADCNTPLGATLANGVCVRPSATQIEDDSSWTITATASFNNGCPATKSITIQNNTKTWNPATASNWTDARWKPTTSVPELDKCVVIKKPVSIGTSTDGLAKNIKIDTGGQLTVSGSLTVNDVINNTTGNARNLIVKSDGNLKQIDDTVVNTTPIAVRRIHTLTPLRRQYNYISSPVKDQNMKLIFGDVTANVPFVTVLNEGTNYFVNAKTADYGIAARGFSVREPKTAYTGVDLGGGANNIASNEAEYKGIPNNGTIPNLALAYTVADGSHGYNVVGNPYPSNLDIVDLYNNSVNNLDIRPEFKFWDNSINDIYTQMGNTYQGYSYAVFNAANGSGLGTAAPGRATLPGDPAGSKVPTRVVKVSQAFMVQALKAGASLKFNNSMRKTTATPFFGKDSPDNYYRLELMTPDSLVIQNAVSYFAGGNAGIGIEDSKIPNASASDAIFNLVEDEKLIINGNPLFTSDHVVKLGTRNSKSGTYQIRAIDQSGIFANGQSIYLKDKQLGILADLTAGAYIFSSESGEFTNRFEIVYKEGVVLATDIRGKSKIEVYRDMNDFVIRSSEKAITQVVVYDASGRLVMSLSGNSKEIRFTADRLVEGMYVLKTTLADEEQITKKIRK